MAEWDDLASCYARLTALRSNLATAHDIDPEYVSEYGSVLARLSDLGFNISDFRIPAEAAQPRVVSAYRATLRRAGGVTYSEKRYVPGTLFRIKLDGLLNLFTLQSERPTIGFNGPRA